MIDTASNPGNDAAENPAAIFNTLTGSSHNGAALIGASTDEVISQNGISKLGYSAILAMLVLPDDDTPKRPDPLLDDLASSQARRALLQAFTESSRQTEEQLTLPVVIHG